jgi:hypothetical protein
MENSNMTSKASCSDLANEHLLAQLRRYSKFKQRSYDTHYNVHPPELNVRLSLRFSLPLTNTAAPKDDTVLQTTDLLGTSKIKAVYLGDSMFERLKTTSNATNLCALDGACNAGCSGDKNENIVYHLE